MQLLAQHRPLQTLPHTPQLNGSLLVSNPSSATRSQSLSIPSQISRSSGLASLHDGAPPEQTVTPSRQASLSAPSQGAPSAGSSEPSALPRSQSSFRPLQMSVVVPVVSSHASPPEQTKFPSAHRSPSAPSQAAPTAGSSAPSAAAVSQSSFTPLHRSNVVPVVSLHDTLPPAPQEVTPSVHRSPSGPSQTRPMAGSPEPSAVEALQSSSTPLHSSTLLPVVSTTGNNVELCNGV